MNCVWSDDERKSICLERLRDISPRSMSTLHMRRCRHRQEGRLARRTTVLQAALFKIANIIPIDDAEQFTADASRRLIGRGEKIVTMNCAKLKRESRTFIRLTSGLPGLMPRMSGP